MSTRLAVTLAILAGVAGCHRAVQNINPAGQRGTLGTYGFWFDDGVIDYYGTPRPGDHALMAAARVILVIQRCDENAYSACISRPDEIVAADPTIVAVDGVETSPEYEACGSFDACFILRGLRAGQTELNVMSDGHKMDSVFVTVADAPHPRFVVQPRRAVPGRYSIGARFDQSVPPLVGSLTDPIIRSAGSIVIPPGHTYGDARAWSVRDNAPPSVGTTFDISNGPGVIEVGTAEIAVLSIETAEARTIVARAPQNGLVPIEENVVEVEVFDGSGLIDGAVCSWTSDDGLEFIVDTDTELAPVKRYWVNRRSGNGTATATCQIGEARAEITLTPPR